MVEGALAHLENVEIVTSTQELAVTVARNLGVVTLIRGLRNAQDLVYEANMELPRRSLVTYTWGNVSGIDREKGLFVIKPSGVEYDELTPDMLVVMDLNGNQVEGDLNPSSDTKTHLELYKRSPRWAVWCIPTAPTPWHGPRLGGISRRSAPPMQTIFTALCPVPVS